MSEFLRHACNFNQAIVIWNTPSVTGMAPKRISQWQSHKALGDIRKATIAHHSALKRKYCKVIRISTIRGYTGAEPTPAHSLLLP